MSPIDDNGYPMPEDPSLVEIASALSDAGHWAEIVDRKWRTVFVTEGLRFAAGFMVENSPLRAGMFIFGPEQVNMQIALPTGAIALDNARQLLAGFGGWVVEDLPGGRDELRTLSTLGSATSWISSRQPVRRLHPRSNTTGTA